MPVTLVVFGDPSTATLSGYRDLGVQRVILGANRTGWGDRSTTMAALDAYGAMIPELA
jgi:hypothetical protein